jgi:hypothetical protein
MTAQVERQQPTHIHVLPGTVKRLLDRQLWDQAWQFTAAYMLWTCDALSAGDITPWEADTAFSLLDSELDNRPGEWEEPAEIQELLFEAHFLHHYGAPADDVSAPDLDKLRGIALRVLSSNG